MKSSALESLSALPSAQLSRLFSSRLLKDLSLPNGGRLLAGAIGDSIATYLSPSTTVTQMYTAAFEALVRSDRSEYVYKNAIARKLLLGRHSVKTTALFFEFPAGQSKLDALFLNGSSHAYEIKTSQDELRRLETQIPDYQKRFEHVWVLTSFKHAQKASKLVPREVGLAVLTERYSIRVLRPAARRIKHLSPEAMLSSMRRSEYINVLKGLDLGGAVAGLPNTEVYSAAKTTFASEKPREIHALMVQQLRKRFEARKALVALSLPYSLTAAGLGLDLSDKQLQRLRHRLDQPIAVLGEV